MSKSRIDQLAGMKVFVSWGPRNDPGPQSKTSARRATRMAGRFKNVLRVVHYSYSSARPVRIDLNCPS